MNLDIIAINVKNLLGILDCRNGQDVKRRREASGIADEPLLYLLPSHNTIDKLLKKETKNPRASILQCFVDCYVKKFGASITIEDFCSDILPCEMEYGMKIPDIYEDFYYAYSHTLSKASKKTKMGMFHIFIRENRYHVRALLNLYDNDSLNNPKLLDLMKNPDCNFEMLHALMPELPDHENYYAYFEGDLEMNGDFVRINLHRPENYPLSTSRNHISIYLRRINEDMRNHLLGAVCIIISNGFNRNLNVQRMLLSNRFFPKEDEMLNQLLNSPDPSITDRDAFGWYRYVRGN